MDEQTSEWYSLSYGSDILTVPSSSIKNKDTFYINVKCEKMCDFEITANLDSEVEIVTSDRRTFVHVSKKSDLLFKYHHNATVDNNHIEFISFSPNQGRYKMYVATGKHLLHNTQ